MKKLLNKKHFQKEIEPVDTTSHIIATVLLSVFIPLLILGIIGLKGAISKNNESIETESIIETETDNFSGNHTKLVSGVIANIQPNLTDVVTEPNSENDVKVEAPKNEILSGYCTTNVNVRKLADVNSDSITVLQFNTPIYYTKSSNNDEWVKVSYNGDWFYIKAEYVSTTECPYTIYTVPNSSFMSYMPYQAINSKTSLQYILRNAAYTGNYGIRMIDGRYCCALGNGLNIKVGDYVDLILENGNVIPIIIADVKDNKDTDTSHVVTVADGSIAEFLVDIKSLQYIVHNNDNTGTGNISDSCSEWESAISEIKVYAKNYFDE